MDRDGSSAGCRWALSRPGSGTYPDCFLARHAGQTGWALAPYFTVKPWHDAQYPTCLGSQPRIKAADAGSVVFGSRRLGMFSFTLPNLRPLIGIVAAAVS
ncbi:hypothetical protein QR97_01905 [Streptomyces sp. PBH53]|nr:hypothetical protein QR97_01905 [Streptomyces sp. PBH53]